MAGTERRAQGDSRAGRRWAQGRGAGVGLPPGLRQAGWGLCSGICGSGGDTCPRRRVETSGGPGCQLCCGDLSQARVRTS